MTLHIEKQKNTSLKQQQFRHRFKEVFKPMRDTISVEQLRKEQNYKGIDKQELDNLIDAINIQEPYEDLLSMLNK